MIKKIPNRTNFKGLEGFINLLLFGNVTTPELINEKYYPLSKIVIETFKADSNTTKSNSYLGMRIFESTLNTLTLDKESRKLRRELAKCYENSFAPNLIDHLVYSQKAYYVDDSLHIFVDDWMIVKCYPSHPKIPIQLKAYLSNQFVDLFENINPRKDKISKIRYHRILEKYLVVNKWQKIAANINRHKKLECL